MKTRSHYRRRNRRDFEAQAWEAALALALVALAMLPLLWAAAFALTIQ